MSLAQDLAAKGALIRAANDVGRTANDFGGLKFTATTTHGVNPLPAAWSGRWVIIKVTGGDVHFAFSKSASAEVDRSAAAAAAGSTTQGTSSKVGDVAPDGLGYETHRKLPTWNEVTETMYFAHEATASTTVYVILGDGDP
jgi:hypothetical protein